jgi:hypothetical protein
LTLSATLGEGNTNFLPLRLVVFLEGTFIGVGFGIGGASLYEDCECTPPWWSFVSLSSLVVLVLFLFLFISEYIVLSILRGICILDYGVGATFICKCEEVLNDSQKMFFFLNSSTTSNFIRLEWKIPV